MKKNSNIEESEKEDVIILRVKGKLDSTLSPILEKRALELINSGHEKIILDLKEISHVNSAGLRTLLSIKKQIKAMQGKLMLASCRIEVLEVMKICGFDHVLDITPSEDDALQKIKI